MPTGHLPHPYYLPPVIDQTRFDIPLPASGKRGTKEAAWEAERVLKSRHVHLGARPLKQLH